MNNLLSLKNQCIDQSVLIVSCGPSASLWREKYNHYKPDKVVAVKQALSLTRELTDYHFFNPYNISCFDYENPNTMSFSLMTKPISLFFVTMTFVLLSLKINLILIPICWQTHQILLHTHLMQLVL